MGLAFPMVPGRVEYALEAKNCRRETMPGVSGGLGAAGGNGAAGARVVVAEVATPQSLRRNSDSRGRWDAIEGGVGLGEELAGGIGVTDFGVGVEEAAPVAGNGGADVERRAGGDGLVETGGDAGGEGGDVLKEEAPAESFVHESDGDAAVEDTGPAGVLRAGDVGGGRGEGAVGIEGDVETEGIAGTAGEAIGSTGGAEGGGADHGSTVGGRGSGVQYPDEMG